MDVALLAVIIVFTGILLVRLQTRHVRRVAAERRSVLADLQYVLDGSELVQRGIDYPVLTGDYRGARVTIGLIVDTLTMRELPTLWLSVTRWRPLPLTGPVDMLLRPSSTDIVSPGERFPVQHPVPQTWPSHIRVATPLGGRPHLHQLSASLPLLHDRRTKDVLLSPTGARLITRLARAELGHYRLVRRPKFKPQLSAEELTASLDAVCAMTEGIVQSAADDRRGLSSASGGT